MKPVRDPRYLAWIRSLPCAVTACWEGGNIEAHHAGARGLSQKADDRSAIPLCLAHHEELHRIGSREFCRRHSLDIPALIARLNAKPLICLEAGVYVGYIEGRNYPLGPRCIGMGKAIRLMREHRRESLAEEWRAAS